MFYWFSQFWEFWRSRTDPVFGVCGRGFVVSGVCCLHCVVISVFWFEATVRVVTIQDFG